MSALLRTRVPRQGRLSLRAARSRFRTEKSRRPLVFEVLECRVLLSDGVFFDPMDGSFALKVTDPPDVAEAAVPIFHDSSLIQGHNHKVVEISDGVPGTPNFPLTVADLAANTFLRVTYQKLDGADGTTGVLGTSVVGSPSFRNASGDLQFIPTVTQSEVVTGGPERYRNQIEANFGIAADVSTVRTFPDDPLIGSTHVGLSVHFEALVEIPLATNPPFPDNDRLRVATFSSMFSSNTQFDANVIRYENKDGVVKTLRLDPGTPRGAHLLPSPDEIGSWLELIKEPTSTWNPDSPTTRIDILDKHGLRLGLQGFLVSSLLPTDDSLSIWLEVLGSPDSIPAGTTFDVDFRITATAPSMLPPPGDTVGLFDPTAGRFLLKNTNAAGIADLLFRYGPAGAGWTPVVGDWDNNPTDTAGLFDSASGIFFLKNSNLAGPADLVFRYGPAGAGWTPVVGDWDGDGNDTVGLFDPASGKFFLKNSNAAGVGDFVFRFGPAGAGWLPVMGDWDGNGTDTPGLFDPVSGKFFLKNSNVAGVADVVLRFGPAGAGWTPVTGDWDGNGTDTAGLFDPANGNFFLKNDNTPGLADLVFRFGPAGAGWTPVRGDWDASQLLLATGVAEGSALNLPPNSLSEIAAARAGLPGPDAAAMARIFPGDEVDPAGLLRPSQAGGEDIVLGAATPASTRPHRELPRAENDLNGSGFAPPPDSVLDLALVELVTEWRNLDAAYAIV